MTVALPTAIDEALAALADDPAAAGAGGRHRRDGRGQRRTGPDVVGRGLRDVAELRTWRRGRRRRSCSAPASPTPTSWPTTWPCSCRRWPRRPAPSGRLRSATPAPSAATSPPPRRPATRCRCWPRSTPTVELARSGGRRACPLARVRGRPEAQRVAARASSSSSVRVPSARGPQQYLQGRRPQRDGDRHGVGRAGHRSPSGASVACALGLGRSGAVARRRGGAMGGRHGSTGTTRTSPDPVGDARRFGELVAARRAARSTTTAAPPTTGGMRRRAGRHARLPRRAGGGRPDDRLHARRSTGASTRSRTRGWARACCTCCASGSTCRGRRPAASRASADRARCWSTASLVCCLPGPRGGRGRGRRSPPSKASSRSTAARSAMCSRPSSTRARCSAGSARPGWSWPSTTCSTATDADRARGARGDLRQPVPLHRATAACSPRSRHGRGRAGTPGHDVDTGVDARPARARRRRPIGRRPRRRQRPPARRRTEGAGRVRLHLGPVGRPACCGAPRCGRLTPAARIRVDRRLGRAGRCRAWRRCSPRTTCPVRRCTAWRSRDQPVFASDVVRYCGEPIAAVAADHPDTARRAAAAIVVDYDVDRRRSSTPRRRSPHAPLHPDGNLFRHLFIRHGDPAARGPIVGRGHVRDRHAGPGVHGPGVGAGHRRPRTAASTWSSPPSGCTTTATRSPSASAFPPDKVRLALGGVGGAFGAREDVSLHVHACLLALRTGRPVKMVYSRMESFLGHVHRHPARIWMRHTADADGTIVSFEARIVLDGGAYRVVQLPCRGQRVVLRRRPVPRAQRT